MNLAIGVSELSAKVFNAIAAAIPIPSVLILISS
jgi:hypothetical protein